MQQLLQNNPFWLFCEQHYAKQACRQALLSLQDDHGMNVNVLLLMAYLDHQHKSITTPQLETLANSCMHLQYAISELRSQRRAFKARQSPLYEACKAAELSLEQLHIAELYQQISAFEEKQCTASDDFASIFLYAASIPCHGSPKQRTTLLEQLAASIFTEK